MIHHPLADYLVEKYLGRQSIAGRVLSRGEQDVLVYTGEQPASASDETSSFQRTSAGALERAALQEYYYPVKQKSGIRVHDQKPHPYRKD